LIDLSGPRRALVWVALIVGVAVLAAVGWGAWLVLSVPDVAGLASAPPDTTAYMRRYLSPGDGEAAAPEFRWRWVPYSAISPNLKRAVLVSEDINFFSHDGFDSHEIGQALRDAVADLELPRGASTITQQLARNLFLAPDRTAARKLQEAILTRRLEAKLSKQRILEIYLNVVEFGPGIYGAEAASRHYFGISALALTERQAAELAAVLPRPSSWHPGQQTGGYRDAVERILGRMQKAEFLWRLI
jgi:monofunctional biosynthetic peptidoglycan transglycosylase